MKKLCFVFLTFVLMSLSCIAYAENGNTDSTIRVKISVENKVMFASFENNATSRAIAAKLPMTVYMKDLYDREMCWHFGPGALPVESLRDDGYDVGDIIYWPPRGSFVILYRQNGEMFTRQHLGHIDGDVSVFESTGDVNVTFELVKE